MKLGLIRSAVFMGGRFAVVGFGLAQVACGSSPELETTTAIKADLSALPNTVVIDWNNRTVAAITENDNYADPLPATRVLSMVHTAIHDAVSATAHRRFHTYAYTHQDRRADPVAAAASAAYHVLAGLFPAQQPALQKSLDASLSSVPDGVSETRGVELGKNVAQLIIERRADDRSGELQPYTPGSAPGDYQYTWDGFIARPGWQNVTPWTLDASSQFRPGPPPRLGSPLYAAAFNEVKSKGEHASTTRSEDETHSARFWYEFSDIGWNRVARIVSAQRGLGLAQTARLFALVNMVMADGYIAGWDAKYFYDFWRPVTAIHAAGTDRNPATAPEPNWQPLLDTPPVQDYPSTHSVLADAAAEILASVLHQDDVTFEMTSSSTTQPNQEPRRWTSFTQAADENADSRVMAGIHFRFATRAGQRLGRKIGRHAFENYLRPLR